MNTAPYTKLYSVDDSGSWVNFQRVLSGGVSASFAKTCMAPLNRLTILQQAQGMTSLQHATSPVYVSIFDSMKLMVRNEGIRSLWNGNGANVMRVIPNYGLRFGLNDISREFVARLYGYDPITTKHSLTRFQLLLAGAIAGVIQITLTYPIELMSTRLTLSGSSLSPIKYKGIVDCVQTVVRTEGVKALFNGYLITLLAGTPYVAIQMSCFELFQRYFHMFHQHWKNRGNPQSSPQQFSWYDVNNPIKEEIGVLPRLAAGACASLFAQTVTYPGDVLRRRMQVDGMGANTHAYRNLRHAVATIYRTEGMKAFFKGIKVNSIRIIPEGAIMFFMFTYMKQSLGIDKHDTH